MIENITHVHLTLLQVSHCLIDFKVPSFFLISTVGDGIVFEKESTCMLEGHSISWALISFINNSYCLSLPDKFINNVLPSHTDVSISKKDALVKFKLSEEEITYVHVNFKPLLNST